MDSIGVVQAQQGVVNQANSNSERANEQREAKTAEAAVPVQRVTNELKQRVDQILAQLKEKGVDLKPHEKTVANHSNDGYIEVLRDVLTGNTTARAVTFDAVASETPPVTPQLPAYPFDRTFLAVNLEFLRALVSGDGVVDKMLAERIRKELEALSKPPESASEMV